MQKSVTIQSLIYRNYLKNSLVPLLLIEVVIIALYFAINFYMSEKTQQVLLKEVSHNLQEVSSREANNIRNQLQAISNYALLIQRDQESFFADSEACFFPYNAPAFSTHANGAYYKLKDNGGSSVYYSSSSTLGEAQSRKAHCSEMLDPILVSIVETSPIVTQAYLNTWDGMNRIYPFIEDLPAQYGPVLHMQEFNFYYQADSLHNPERKPVWTGAYLDPAGQGWMVSNIVPIYRDDFLEGVSGLDLTIESFLDNILNLDIPWNATTFMVDKNGMILAMQAKIKELLKLKGLNTYIEGEKILTTLEKPDQYNILSSENGAFQQQMQFIFDSQLSISKINIDGITYIVSQEVIQETGWRLISLVEEALVLQPIVNIKQLSKEVGYLIIAAMLLFYAIFFLFLLRKSRQLTSRIATPIEQLSTMTRGLGKNIGSQEIAEVGIVEIDHLSNNFNEMVDQLETRTDALVALQLSEEVRAKEAELLARLALTDSLTNLGNRRKLDKTLTAENDRAIRFNHAYGVLLLDIDYFKQVNDPYGHQVGDQVLVELANLLKTLIRKTDTLGRWGGEEFLIICPEIDQNGI
ncbi:diguanylate cyclase [Psychromonas sp. MME2]